MTLGSAGNTDADWGGADVGGGGRGVFVAQGGENVRGGGGVGYTWWYLSLLPRVQRLSSGLVVESVMPARRLFYWRNGLLSPTDLFRGPIVVASAKGEICDKRRWLAGAIGAHNPDCPLAAAVADKGDVIAIRGESSETIACRMVGQVAHRLGGDSDVYLPIAIAVGCE